MKSKNKQKRTLRLPLLIVAGLGLVLLLFVAYTLINRQIERQRFLSLDTRMQQVAQTLQSIDPAIKWTEKKGCVGYGTFNDQPHCKVTLTTTIDMSSSKNFVQKYKQYEHYLTEKEHFRLQFEDPQNNAVFPDSLNVTRVVSSLIEEASGLSCTFDGILNDINSTLPSALNTPIASKSAPGLLSLSCEANTLAHWYPRTDFNLDVPPATF